MEAKPLDIYLATGQRESDGCSLIPEEHPIAFGGEPTTKARVVPGATHNKDMLERVLEAEKRAIVDYTKRAEQAGEFGDKGLQVQLEDMVREESRHYEETERMLREWPL